jgi:DNA ligase (NAD+)
MAWATSWVEQLVDIKHIHAADLYKLGFTALAGPWTAWPMESARNHWRAGNIKQTTPRFIFGGGHSAMSETTAKALAHHFGQLDAVM